MSVAKAQASATDLAEGTQVCDFTLLIPISSSFSSILRGLGGRCEDPNSEGMLALLCELEATPAARVPCASAVVAPSSSVGTLVPHSRVSIFIATLEGSASWEVAGGLAGAEVVVGSEPGESVVVVFSSPPSLAKADS